MHIITWLKNGLNDKLVAEKALEYGLYTPPLSFYCENVKLPDAIILGYTGITPQEIKINIKKLREMFEKEAKGLVQSYD
jgi:DNA-binding transcriptional MocR family regulator